jgi:glutamyl-tRNA synthetase
MGEQKNPPTDSMTVRVRIAPSPTGNLHIGTARTAVFNWLHARSQGGTFILRIEDTDLERSKPEFTENIMTGLKWLGLDWDEGPFYQTQRSDLYAEKIQSLLDRGLAYRAYDTPAELEAMREAQKVRKQAPRYDNRHRHLTPEQIAAYEAEGRTAVIRFKIEDDREISWEDMVRGKVTWKGSDLGGDMVIARAASGDSLGAPLYNFVVVVDDIDMGITQVIRGEDHIGNTPKQILLYEALGAAVPTFGHTPQGAKLSKRDGVTSVGDFQKMGYLPEALANYMTLLGWSPTEALGELFSLEGAAKEFSFDRVTKAGGKFDWDKLNWVNGQYIHKMPVPELTTLLMPYWEEAGFELNNVDRAWLEQLVAVVGPSLAKLSEVGEMTRYLFVDNVGFTEDAQAHLKQAGVKEALEGVLAGLSSSMTEESAKALIDTVVKGQGVKKGLVMKSLRAGLTGSLQGPDLMQSWLLLSQKGWDRNRLEQAIAAI